MRKAVDTGQCEKSCQPGQRRGRTREFRAHASGSEALQTRIQTLQGVSRAYDSQATNILLQFAVFDVGAIPDIREVVNQGVDDQRSDLFELRLKYSVQKRLYAHIQSRTRSSS